MGVTGAVRLAGTIRCALDEAELLRAAIPAHVALTQAEPGCISFDIRGTDDPCVYEVAERFRDDAAFEAHQARTRASAWWRSTGHMTRDFEITRE